MSFMTDARHHVDRVADDWVQPSAAGALDGLSDLADDAADLLDDVRSSSRIRTALLAITVIGVVAVVVAMVRSRQGGRSEDRDTPTVPEEMLRATG